MAHAFEELLRESIYPFWEKQFDSECGGIVGQTDYKGRQITDAPKGLVQQSRHLWFFSEAGHFLKNPKAFSIAENIFQFLEQYFYNRRTGSWNYLVTREGTPLETRQHVYALSFAVYALSAFARITQSQSAARLAYETFQSLERHARDSTHGGYHECFTSEWAKLPQMNEYGVTGFKKTMNAHIHLLEATTELFRLFPDQEVRRSLNALIDIILDRIIDPRTNSLNLYFQNDWEVLESPISFGHDIELSWLLWEAVEATGHRVLDAKRALTSLAYAVQEKGLDPKGGVFYEADRKTGVLLRPEKIWWVQAEAAVGFLNAYHVSKCACFLEAHQQVCEWIVRFQQDQQFGDWFESADRAGFTGLKGHLWKAGYHNGRACLKVAQLSQYFK